MAGATVSSTGSPEARLGSEARFGDRRLRRRAEHDDGELACGGRRILVARRVAGVDGEGVGAGAQRLRRVGRSARLRQRLVDLADEGRICLVRAEGECRGGVRGISTDPVADRRLRRVLIRRRRADDRETSRCRRLVGVVGRVGRRDREGVRALRQHAGGVGRRACDRGLGVDLAAEGRARLGGGERERRRGVRRLAARAPGDRRYPAAWCPGRDRTRRVTDRASLIVTLHELVPEQAPLQPEKLEPAAGVAARATTVPAV